ncbi:hypothetical protein MSAN_02125700 [Mycena sanguinolenta]|uniref:Uncharacterized protein n=1 Tax=Mycena sanguinolenta TaxID=230812 RepID=A0A8H7CLN8_9AGAR|nr:hypothetical protein MSAN_02125700 [Mycena sanguinolenta]
MHLAHSLWTVAALCVAVHGGLTNFTLDDASPVISYTPAPLQQCTPEVCPEPAVPPYNGTSSTVVVGHISIPFVGSAVYVYLSVQGSCSFNLDDQVVGNASNLEFISLAFSNDSLPDSPHVLMIYPGLWGSLIELDYVVFSHNVRTSRGAIIGGVVGGIAAATVLSIGGFLLRRRQKRKQLSTRGVPLGDHWPDKPSIQLAEMGKREQK